VQLEIDWIVSDQAWSGFGTGTASAVPLRATKDSGFSPEVFLFGENRAYDIRPARVVRRGSKFV